MDGCLFECFKCWKWWISQKVELNAARHIDKESPLLDLAEVAICIKNDEFCIKNDEFCIKNDEFCIKNDEFCIQNDGFCI